MPFALYPLALAVFVMGTSEFMLAGLLPSIAAQLGVGVGTAGLLTSAFAIGMIVGAPATAAFAHRWPARFTMTACVLVFALCHVAGALTSEFWILLVVRVLSALANAGFLAVALSAAMALAPADRKGRAAAILLSGTTVALIAGVPAGALIGSACGWRATFWVVAALGAVAVIGILRGVSPGPLALEPRGTTDLAPEIRQLRSRRLLLTMLVGALISGGTFSAFTFLAPLVTRSAGLGDGWTAPALVEFGVGSFLGVTLAGRLSDRRPGLVLAAGGPLLLAGWVALGVLAQHPAAVVVLVFGQGVLGFGVGSTVIARILYAAPDAPTLRGAFATAALNVGAAAGPAIGAAALTAGTAAPVWVAAAMTAAGLAVAIPATSIGRSR
ncbi:MFS transporter [Galbitalea sp. SE-J8]|uniref:Cmx/CmrA family chloramphenicol efflux MFS transporter n=1 Tax=Galbitalea sp. SE-J8 TaxID=3054952 RepID=UPI00259CD3A7|nr:Cmx/CmrA family chloramphenicol efflux MFS transporter [Galbitalea sp. SE-J8]MDM4761718.1 MFS transporter [Galbitalea sp. SE-J8]